MREMLLLKCGELMLKGLNRSRFVAKLIENVSYRLKPIGKFEIYSIQSTIYVEPHDDSTFEEALSRISKIFGIVAIMRAAVCEKNIDAIDRCAAEYLKPLFSEKTTFKVKAKRSDKNFPMTSPEIAVEVGGYLHEQFPQIVPDMENPEVVVNVEVRDRYAFVCAKKIPGAGGMPVGSNGKAALLLSGGIDSPVAGYLMSRRGLALSAVHFFSYPYTSEQALEKVRTLGEIISEYCGTIKFYTVPFTKIQEQIRKNCPEEYFTIIMRRFMMRIAEKTAESDGCKALVTGESLGQVASQTAEAIGVTENVCTLPVLRPLIGMDKTDIISVAEKIGTFQTSILPYEDCCTVFTPKHPCTKPKLDKIEQSESHLDIDSLVAEAVAGTTCTELKHQF